MRSVARDSAMPASRHRLQKPCKSSVSDAPMSPSSTSQLSMSFSGSHSARRSLDAGILDVLDLVELDAPWLAVHHLHPADVDRLHRVARSRIDRYRPARAHPLHPPHCLDELVTARVCTGALCGFVNDMHAVIATDRVEVRPHAAVGFHERIDVRLVLGRIVCNGI